MHISSEPSKASSCAVHTGSAQVAKKHRRPVAGIALGLVGVGCYIALRHWYLGWGATPSERAEHLPGDDLLQHPSLTTTRAVTIHASPEEVWPWLVQMGQDRAGLYSYDWLENLCGLQFCNADHLVAEWQHLDIGDQIRAAPPSAGPEAGFTVVAVEPGQYIVTAIGEPAKVLSQARDGRLPEGGTWTFVLRPAPGGTRLIVRLRARFGVNPIGEQVGARLLEPIHFFMERKQLLGIRQRAEGQARRESRAVSPVSTILARRSAPT